MNLHATLATDNTSDNKP